ncbi:sensor histidine kinase [Nakamurella lactea]|uniref:sensor histidine kinase n=1 Tax=Nakamurella lactea TaxID=459515 RepID=UPI000688CDD9|nr:sensor domain-containing protein [Nakamurella lactea]
MTENPAAAYAAAGGGSWDTARGPQRMSSTTIEQRADRPASPGRRYGLRRAGRDAVFVLSWFPLAIGSFLAVGATFLLGLALSITVIGLPVLAWCAFTARGLAVAKRRMIRRFMHRAAPTPKYLRSDGGFVARARTTLTDSQSWWDIVHGLFGFIIATVTFAVTLVWWSVAFGGLSWLVWGWAPRLGDDNASLPEVMGLGNSYLVELAFYTVLGLLFLITLPAVMRAMAWIDTGPALLLLSGRANQQREVEYLVKGREAARTAEAGSLRRLERDIHDGPQQRLVRLGMDLGRAKRQIDKDPELARSILDETIAQTRQTLEELRALSRGIAPPVLADRGLRAAMEEIVARSTVPVHLKLDLSDDLPDHVQTAAYFVVSEALVNVAKHAMATYAVVELTTDRKVLTVKVSDDGVGGAQLAKGHGLVGLADRVRGVDGILNVTSPPGGPTELVAEIACG